MLEKDFNKRFNLLFIRVEKVVNLNGFSLLRFNTLLRLFLTFPKPFRFTRVLKTEFNGIFIKKYSPAISYLLVRLLSPYCHPLCGGAL